MREGFNSSHRARGGLAAMRASLASVALWAAGATAAANAAPSVAVDLAPLHSLTAMVMEGVGEPALIVPQNASPHGYAMRPSEARALAGADLVIWLGAEAAPWFVGPLSSLAPDAATVPLAEIEGVQRRDLRDELHRHDDHDNHADEGHADEGHAKEGHDHGPLDPHLWLDPANAVIWIDAIASALSVEDPENSERYAANAASARASVVALGDEIDQALSPVRSTPFIVFHDAYGYFEDRFGLHSVGAVALSDGARPGARRLSELRAAVEANAVRCIFTEPQFDAKIAAAIAGETGARLAELDPLGAALEPGPTLYPALLRALTASLTDCLTP